MRSIEELYGRHPGSDIYVVGTGASLRVFPLSFLEDKITIGLNMAWKVAPVQYSITIRPELNIPEFMGEPERPDTIWCVSERKLTSDEQRKYCEAHPDRFFAFDTKGQRNTMPNGQPGNFGRNLDWVRRPTGHFLYVWSSISQSAANLAANMGAKNVILIGCDNCALEGNHHAHNQHVFWKGEDPNVRYRQYEEGLVEVRTALRERGVTLLNLTPFVSLERPGKDFRHLCVELGQETYIPNHDITVESQAPNFLQRVGGRLGKLPKEVQALLGGTASRRR
jgi:hypothetical protein